MLIYNINPVRKLGLMMEISMGPIMLRFPRVSAYPENASSNKRRSSGCRARLAAFTLKAR
jgi:hypothetical protein